MKLRTSLAAAGAAVVLGTTGTLVLPSMASADASTSTLTLIAVQKATVSFTQTTGANQETDMNAGGKTIGFDMIYFAATSPSNASVNATFDIKGGLLYGTATVSIKTGAVTNGKVTGGTGAFKGATGTIKVKSLNKAGTRHAVTITYST